MQTMDGKTISVPDLLAFLGPENHGPVKADATRNAETRDNGNEYHNQPDGFYE